MKGNLLTATDISHEIGISVKSVNPLLCKMGFVTGQRDYNTGSCSWELTDSGRALATERKIGSRSDGKQIAWVKWSNDIVPLIRDFIKKNEINLIAHSANLDKNRDRVFYGKIRVQKSVETIAGLFQGLGIDHVITDGEADFLRRWIGDHHRLRNRHPFNEIIPTIEQTLADNIITEEEKQDILWLCEKLSEKGNLIAETTQSIQRLHGILGGIIADAEIQPGELNGLSDWLQEHEHLKTCWPYDEVDALVFRAFNRVI